MNESNNHTLILGIGNILMGDEGVGVHAIHMLEGAPLPSHVSLLDGGTGTFYLLEAMQNASQLIIIDATLDGNAPGTINRLTPRYSSDYPRSLTAHDIGLKDLIDAFYLMGQTPSVVLYTVTVTSLKGDLSMELSPPLASALPELCDRILKDVSEATDRPGLSGTRV